MQPDGLKENGPVKGIKRLRSMVGRLTLLVSRKTTSAGSSDSPSSMRSSIPSPSAPLSLDSESIRPQLSLSSLPRSLISLLEIGSSNRRDSPSIPLPIYALKACHEDKGRMATILKLDSTSAARLADIVQACLDLPPSTLGPVRPSLTALLQIICSTHSLLPERFLLRPVSFDARRSIGNGPDSSIYEGAHEEKPVAVREIFIRGGMKWHSAAGKARLKAMLHELAIHLQMKHSNLLPILGIFLENDTTPLIVYPFVRRGTAIAWSRDYGSPEAMAKILQGAANGLAHLHSQDPPIVHANIHPNNILIDDEGGARICDFGLNRIRHAAHGSPSAIEIGSKWRYMAPELFTETENLLPTKASDIYALSMTFLAIITLRPPFSEYAHDFGASYACQKGMRPNKPKEVVTLTQAQADALWDLLELMWQQEPCARPRATDVFEYLRRKLRHHGDSTRLPESPATYPKSRARTMSSSAISKHQKFSVNNGTGINKSLKRLDDAQPRARVFSAPSTPKLATLVE